MATEIAKPKHFYTFKIVFIEIFDLEKTVLFFNHTLCVVVFKNHVPPHPRKVRTVNPNKKTTTVPEKHLRKRDPKKLIFDKNRPSLSYAQRVMYAFARIERAHKSLDVKTACLPRGVVEICQFWKSNSLFREKPRFNFPKFKKRNRKIVFSPILAFSKKETGVSRI